MLLSLCKKKHVKVQKADLKFHHSDIDNIALAEQFRTSKESFEMDLVFEGQYGYGGLPTTLKNVRSIQITNSFLHYTHLDLNALPEDYRTKKHLDIVRHMQTGYSN